MSTNKMTFSSCLLKVVYLKLFHWYVVWLVAQGFFATGLYGWRVAWLVVWLIWSHVTFQFSFQSIITTYHFNWHISAFKPRFHTRTLVDRLLANMMAPVSATMHYFVYHINTIVLYWEEKPTSLINENKWIDNPWITIVECVGADS